MSKHYKHSKTIKGAIKAEKTATWAAPLGGLAALGTELLISEIGAPEAINDGIRNISNGLINGDDVKTVAINTGIIVLSGFIAKAIATKNSEQIIQGRIDAEEPISISSLPNRYNVKPKITEIER